MNGFTIARLAAASLLLAAAAGHSHAQNNGPVKIGVLNDQSSIYAPMGGLGSVEAARLAVEDNGLVLGQKVEVVAADHQNKADIGGAIARKWYEEAGVDMITDVPNSAVGFAVQHLARENKKLVLTTGTLSTDFTGPRCTPYSAAWVIDTYAQAKVLGTAVVKAGGKSWYFIGADYSFGHGLVKDAKAVVEANGGKVLGSIFAPLGAADFSSFLLQAKASGAQIIALANGAGDTLNSLKQAHEFGLSKGGQKMAAFIMFLQDVKGLGLDVAQGLQLSTPFYWDFDDDTRAFSKRFKDRVGSPPTWDQAGVYSAVNHYLKAVNAVGSKDPDKVMAKMRETPINDFMSKNARLRIDGRVVRDMHLFEVKKPSESAGEWDFYKFVATIPGDQAYRPLAEGNCPLAEIGTTAKN